MLFKGDFGVKSDFLLRAKINECKKEKAIPRDAMLSLNNAIQLKAKAPLLLHSFTLPTTKITLAFRSVSTPLNASALSLNTTTPNTIPFLPSPFLRCRAAMTTTACVQVREQIELTETEKKIFDRLLKTLRHFNLQTQLRVAGGWVRDKVILLIF